MKYLIVNEVAMCEDRVSMTPDTLGKLVSCGNNVFIERGAGERSGFADEEYIEKGGLVIDPSPLSQFDCVISINCLSVNRIKSMRPGEISVALQDPYNNPDNVQLLADGGIISFALDHVPRTTRSQYMDVLSSQASLAGYMAVIEASHLLNRAFPLMMTTAGTIPPTKVLVIGAGVAGLQAIATARRLGAVVEAFDIRREAKEQVLSLGAEFIEIESIEGASAATYEVPESCKKAHELKLRTIMERQDVVITTAQIPGKRAPIIISSDMINCMRKGSLIIDLASRTGGNCELTEHGKTIVKNGVSIVSFENILNQISFDASRLFSKNIYAFLELLTKEMQKTGDVLKIEDEIVKGLCCYGFRRSPP
jgi:NAD(P) transhydrogenase subunit alpha